MKCDERGNVWVTAPGGVVGLRALGRPDRQAARAGAGRQSRLGRPRFPHPVLTATHSVYRVETKVGPRREPFMNARRRRPGARGRPLRPSRPEPDPRPEALRPDHPGHAERRHRRGRRLRRVGRAGACARRTWSRTFAGSLMPRARAGFRSSTSGSSSSRRAGASRSTRRCSRAWSSTRRWCAATWGAAPVKGLEPQPAISIVEKMR
jgi:gluconolactonase